MWDSEWCRERSFVSFLNLWDNCLDSKLTCLCLNTKGKICSTTCKNEPQLQIQLLTAVNTQTVECYKHYTTTNHFLVNTHFLLSTTSSYTQTINCSVNQRKHNLRKTLRGFQHPLIKKKNQTLTLCNFFLDAALILALTVILQNCRFHCLAIQFTQ